ncbi:MAG TPA: sigma-70 family RNA polymerase sigma factor [Verrucomicrobiae bacterium]|nr:sigma-70 family RNA polymerase sigma factor [Verrucomicrobiae bacterium]
MREAVDAEPDDRELVERCQRGNLDAYGALVNRYRQRVYGLAFSMLRNPQDASDLSQETFVKAWQAIRGFKKNASFYTWLYRITTNLCIDFVRKRDRRPTVPFEEAVDPDADVEMDVAPSNQPSPTDEVRRRELREQIDAALLELSPEHRAVIQLREFDGLEYAEIAEAVGCSLGTVMSRLHYARKHLQKLLRDVI